MQWAQMSGWLYKWHFKKDDFKYAQNAEKTPTNYNTK